MSDAAERNRSFLAFLEDFSALRRKRITKYKSDDELIWFGELPQGRRECRSRFLTEEEATRSLLLEMRKKPIPRRPTTPTELSDWVHDDILDQWSEEPELPDRITVLVDETVHPPGEQPWTERRPRTVQLEDEPEVEDIWITYLVEEWEPWAEKMRRWWEVQSVYDRLDSMRRTIEASEENYELVVGIGLLIWRDPKGKEIRRHVLTAPAEISLDAPRGVLRADMSASFERFRVELDMLERSEQPHVDTETMDDLLADLDVDAWNRDLVGPILHEIANRLRSDAQVEVNEWDSARQLTEHPILVYAPALVVRGRQSRAYDDLIRQFQVAADNGAYEPTGPWRLFLQEGQDAAETNNEPLPTPDQPGKERVERVLFPLATNKEQLQIIERLKVNRCVLVKGPPGTGKSHTIANLISHLLACGDRVLVTAQAPKALTVLRKLLPEGIRDLCVTSLGSSREDQRLLEDSVARILGRLDDWTGVTSADGAILRAKAELKELEGKKARAERLLRESREAETHTFTLNGSYEGTATQIAEQVDGSRARFGWLPDTDTSDPHQRFPLSVDDVDFLASFHQKLTIEKMDDLNKRVGIDTLPDPDGFEKLIACLKQAESLLDRTAAVATPAVEAVGPGPGEPPPRAARTTERHVETLDARSLEKLGTVLRGLDAESAKASRVLGDLTETVLGDCLVGSSERWERLIEESQRFIDDATERIEQIGTTEVDLPTDPPPNRLLADARRRRDHFRQGGRRGISVLVPKVVKDTRYIIDMCLVDGSNSDSEKDLELIVARLELDQGVGGLESLWPDLMRPLQPRKQSVEQARGLTSSLRDLLRFFESRAVAGSIDVLSITERQALSSPQRRAEWVKAIDAEQASRHAHRTRSDVDSIGERIRRMLARWDFAGAEAHPCITVLIEAIEARDTHKWEAGWRERERIRREQSDLEIYHSLLDRLRDPCPRLTELLKNTEGDPEWSTKIREIEQAWAWSQASSWLRNSADSSAYENANQQIHRLQERIMDRTEKLASRLAWKSFINRVDSTTKSSMIAWRKAVRRIGKGTGKYAYRNRRDARRYLMDCVPRIPAWVMPLHKLWDTVGPEAGMFDTVIVDEASQAGVDSLLLLLFAKRIIVVGDDMQNSPEAVGVREDDIRSLASTHLRAFRYHAEFRPDASLFDHAERTFGTPITLREHFRCVPEIILFSDDLCYRQNAPLVPLRQAPHNRLQPLKHHYVAEGACSGSRAGIHNRAEADALAEAVTSAVESGDYEGKTFGIIALQGRRQAELIYETIARRLSSSRIHEHKLRCGVPATFQGDERDVIFLSLVVAPNYRFRAVTGLADQRRFNVAMSRARDQVWLFHSVQQHDLRRDDLRYRLLHFFQSPRSPDEIRIQTDLDELERHLRTSPRDLDTQPDPFDSWFEVDVAVELLRRRYRVTPQVDVAGYRIDLVVEGIDRRLAVECDGDAWHGPERFDADMDRQRQLERAGWTFVRVRESHFMVDRQAAIRTITDVCAEMRIRPVDRVANARPHPRSPIATSGPAAPDARATAHEDVLSECTNKEEEGQSETDGRPFAAQFGSRESRQGLSRRPHDIIQPAVGPPDRDLANQSQSDHVPVPYRETAGTTEVTRHECPLPSEQRAVVSATGPDSGREPFSGYSNSSNFPDPRESHQSAVSHALREIIHTDGPLTRKSLYRLYVIGCPATQRAGKIVKQTLNRVIRQMIQAGEIVEQRELDGFGNSTLLHTVLRVADMDPVRVRALGSRDLLEVPPSELREVARTIPEKSTDDEELLRQLLEHYGGLKLTKRRQRYLSDTLGLFQQP